MPRPLIYNIIRVGDSLLSRVLVAFVSRTNKSKTEIAAPSVPERVQRLALFGPPPLIEGEDAAAYDRLVARIVAAVKPVDVIDEMFTADVVFLEWEVLRLRRLKWSLIRARGFKALEDFMGENLEDDLYSETLADDLREIFQDNLPEDQSEDAQKLARECAQNKADAVAWSKDSPPHRTGHGPSPGPCEGPQGKRTRAGVRAARTGRRETGR
jgi:hypothetical protein